MITKYDELFCHQTVSTFDRPGTSAREWTERAWLQIHHVEGGLHLATGFGYYPNRNIMDAYVCFTIQDQVQYTVRASRELRPEIDRFEVGPFRYEVIEPLKVAAIAPDLEFLQVQQARVGASLILSDQADLVIVLLESSQFSST